MDLKKAGCKNRVIVVQKEKRQPGLFSFCMIMTLLFAAHNSDLFFKFQTLKKYQANLIN